LTRFLDYSDWYKKSEDKDKEELENDVLALTGFIVGFTGDKKLNTQFISKPSNLCYLFDFVKHCSVTPENANRYLKEVHKHCNYSTRVMDMYHYYMKRFFMIYRREVLPPINFDHERVKFRFLNHNNRRIFPQNLYTQMYAMGYMRENAQILKDALLI
jgi:hypothetical protein